MDSNRWTTLNRRQFLQVAPAATLGAQGCLEGAASVSPVSKTVIGLGFSLYGMQGLTTVDALRTCAQIGYDGVEFMVYPGSRGDPNLLSAPDRLELQKLFHDLGVGLVAMGEDLTLVVDDTAHRQNLERIKRAGDLFQDLHPFWKRRPSRRSRMPTLVVTLGGKSQDWPEVKNKMAQRLHEWGGAAASAGILLAVKAHVGSALHTPEDAQWLRRQADHPWVKLAFDYSHFFVQGFDMKESMRIMLPDTIYIHAKDAAGEPAKVQFLLPGEGKIDYIEYMRRLQASGYRGSVVVEVSAQIQHRPGYDPIAAARKSYAVLARAFTEAGVMRG
jgi:sugar phosphate isomerase/epimerase